MTTLDKKISELTVAPSNSAGFVPVEVAGTTYKTAIPPSINVRNFEAEGDGVADDTAAIRAAHAAAKVAGLPLYLPAGRYRYVWESGNYLMPFDGLTVIGDGMFKSVIVYDTPASTPASTEMLFGSYSADAVACEGVEFRDFAVEGKWLSGGDYNDYPYYPFLLWDVTNVLWDRVRVNKSTIMSIAARRTTEMRVTNCLIDYSARDGISSAGCNEVVISDNSIRYCGDDAIAIHGNSGGKGVVVSGNSILMAIGGISGHSCHRASIVGNHIMLTTQKGIDVDTNGVDNPTGARTGMSIVVANNVIANVCNRTAVDNASAGGTCILIGGESATAGSLAVTPGRNDTATGNVILPFTYAEAAGATVANNLPMMGSMAVIVANNTCVWDLATAGEDLSSYGYGEFLSGITGVANAYDPVVDDNLRTQYGIEVAPGLMDGVHISGNMVMGTKYAMMIADDADIRNMKVVDNTFMSVTTGGFLVNGTDAASVDIEFARNTFDLDPYFQDAERDTDGSWAAATALQAVIMQNLVGFKFIENTFRNCSRICDKSVTSDASFATAGFWYHNLVECDPVAVGFSASNKGVGHVPNAGEAFLHRIVECDPNQAAYGKVKNNCLPAATAMPTTGTYVAGHFVRNSSPAVAGGGGSQYAVLGWIRLTTGSGHVADTDWIAARTLTGT